MERYSMSYVKVFGAYNQEKIEAHVNEYAAALNAEGTHEVCGLHYQMNSKVTLMSTWHSVLLTVCRKSAVEK